MQASGGGVSTGGSGATKSFNDTCGSATIHFRKLIDGTTALSPASLHEVLTYSVDVNWVTSYLLMKSPPSPVWAASTSPSFVQRLIADLLTLIATPSVPESRLVNALDTLGACLRAVMGLPHVDFGFNVLQTLCGVEAADDFLANTLAVLCGVLKSTHTPVCKAAAAHCLLVIAAALPNLHENVLMDHFIASSALLLDTFTAVLQQRSLYRGVAADVLALLALSLQYQRYDTRNPFVAHIRSLAVDTVLGPGASGGSAAGAGAGGAASRRTSSTGSAPDSPTAVDDHTSALSFSSRSLVPSRATAGTMGMCKALEAVAAACRAQLNAVAQRPVLGTAGTRAAAADSRVTNAGSLAPSSPSSGVFSTLSGAVSSVWSMASRALSAATTSKPAPPDPVLAACTGRMGSGAPPAPALRAPARLPFVTRVAVVLLTFFDAFCTTPEGMFLAAGGNTWRAHAGASPLPSAVPELLRQVLSLTSFALQSNERELPRLGLAILQRLLEGVPVANPVTATAADHRRAKAMHTLMHATYLDTDSTNLELYERGHDGGFFVATCKAVPLSAAVFRMTCHCISVRTKGTGVTGPVVQRAMRVLHRVMYHQAHVRRRVSSFTDLASAAGGGSGAAATPTAAAVSVDSPAGTSAAVQGSAVDWLHVVRSLLRVAKRLVGVAAGGDPLTKEAKHVASETARLLDMCLTGLSGESRLNVYYECIRERNVLEAFRQLLLKQFAADASRMSSRMDAATMPAAVLNAMVATLPPRLALCVRNLHAILQHLAEHLSKAAMALVSSGQHMLHEEDVIKVVAEATPWRQVEAADRVADAYTLYSEAPSDCGMFGSLARGVTEDLRAALRLSTASRR